MGAKRRRRMNLARPEPHMNIKQTVLIVCEGKNTEPSYFEQFRVSTVTIKTVGVGEGTTRLVEQAKKIANNNILI